MSARERRTGRPTRDEAAAIDRIVLKGARAVFCHRGFAAASMDEIAAAVGVSKITIYRRYPSKNALLEAVVDADLAALADSVTANDHPEQDPLGALKSAARTLFRFSIEPSNIRFSALLLAESIHNEALLERFVLWERIVLTPLIERIERAQAAGRLRPGGARDAALVLMDLIDSAAKRLRHGRRDVFADRSPEQFFEERWAVFEKAMTPE